MATSKFMTVATFGYTYDISRGTEPSTTGGVHHHQIRKTTKGWRRRIIQSNGRNEFVGPSEPISEAEAERLMKAGRNER